MNQDADCLICFGEHDTNDCPERKPQHCQNCHVFILRCSDHSNVCPKKTWVHQIYKNLYVAEPKDRFIIGFDCAFRVLINGCWRKVNEDLELYSKYNGAVISFKSDLDLCVSTRSFAPIRISIVVKDSIDVNDVFNEKLVLLTSRKQGVVAKLLDKPFDRNDAKQSHELKTTLIVALNAKFSPKLSVNDLTKQLTTHEIQFENVSKQFLVPDALRIKVDDDKLPKNGCDVCYGAHHSDGCEQKHTEKCFECHVPILVGKDHAENCSAKFFVGVPIQSIYAQIPVLRCTLRFQSTINYQLDRELCKAAEGLTLFSPDSDTLFKFRSNSMVDLLTTGFTRIRVPIVVKDGGTMTERLVIMTSQDRTIVAAKGSRPIYEFEVPEDIEHNTPMVFHVASKDICISLEVHSSGGETKTHIIRFIKTTNQFQIPNELDVKTNQFSRKLFDANLPVRKLR